MAPSWILTGESRAYNPASGAFTSPKPAKPFALVKSGGAPAAKLEVPITDPKQSAHIRITGTLQDASYAVKGSDLVFERSLHGLRNTILLPAGYEVEACSQSGTVGMYQGRAFVALINLNGENEYRVAIRARKKS